MKTGTSCSPANYYQSALVRADLSKYDLRVSDGAGSVGSAVLIEMLEGGHALTDHRGRNVVLKAGDQIVAALGNRDSSTHASGEINARIEIAEGMLMDWLRGFA